MKLFSLNVRTIILICLVILFSSIFFWNYINRTYTEGIDNTIADLYRETQIADTTDITVANSIKNRMVLLIQNIKQVNSQWKDYFEYVVVVFPKVNALSVSFCTLKYSL